jgi:hypothetical protein
LLDSSIPQSCLSDTKHQCSPVLWAKCDFTF